MVNNQDSKDSGRLAAVIFNLGGPDSPEAIQPFLFNLFNDPAILRLPNPLRWCLAKLISWRRAPISKEIYKQVGGQSPLLPYTEDQAAALKTEIEGFADHVEVFIFMRYWHPMVEETVGKIKAFDPDRIVMLPLYPQFSTTTTGTSLKAFDKEAQRQGLDAPRSTICCYPLHHGFLDATVANIRKALEEASQHGTPRLLLSAHGLPERTVKAGDPYQWQMEQTSMAIAEALDVPDLDWLTCYQSRVGPVKWIPPYTEDEVRRAGEDGVPIVIAPIAFVSEHVETLVELDIEFRELAEESGVPHFSRVPAVAADCTFIRGLGDLVRGALDHDGVASDIGVRRCPMDQSTCPNRVGVNATVA